MRRKSVIKILSYVLVVAICSWGFLPTMAAKPQQKDCHAVEVMQSSYSSRGNEPKPGFTTLTAENVQVICEHKDGTRVIIPLGNYKRVTEDSKVPRPGQLYEDAAKTSAVAILKRNYCPQHGCNK